MNLKFKVLLAAKRLRFDVLSGYMMERVISRYQNNPSETIYIIRRSGQDAGIISNFFHVIGHSLLAKRRGWQPVVDMQNYDWYCGLTYEQRTSFNIWDKIFAQPSSTQLSEAWTSKNIVLSDGSYPFDILGANFSFLSKAALRQEIFRESKILLSNVNTSEYIENHLKRIPFHSNTRILGVASRGTCMLNAPGHNAMPTSDELLQLAATACKENSYDYVYLTTEEEIVVNAFSQLFKERLVIIPRKRVSAGDHTKMPEWNPDSCTHPLDVALDYLAEIVALSRCTSFMGGLTNGTALALLINNSRYESITIPNKGIQPLARNRNR